MSDEIKKPEEKKPTAQEKWEAKSAPLQTPEPIPLPDLPPTSASSGKANTPATDPVSKPPIAPKPNTETF